jgi:hypothetical protein
MIASSRYCSADRYPAVGLRLLFFCDKIIPLSEEYKYEEESK